MKDLMEQTEDSIKHISDSRARSQANISISNKNMEVTDVIFVRGWGRHGRRTGRRPVTTRDPGCAINQLAAATGLAAAGAAEDEAVPLKMRLVPLKMRLVPPQRRLGPMGSIMWERDVAEVYDQTYRAKFEPSVLDPIVDLLAGLAGGGPVLEFAVGTGRVALPLSARGIPCTAWGCRRTWRRSCRSSPVPTRSR
jgi:hypothetical protein